MCLVLHIGNYWIDPNQGSPVDSIEVYCNIKAHQTCVYAKPSIVGKGTWYDGTTGEHIWFGEEMHEGFTVSVCLTFAHQKLKINKNEIFIIRHIMSDHCSNNSQYLK